MKNFWLFFGFCLSILSYFSANGQPTPNYAGPDKVVCSGECVEIGRNENSDCKYFWTPDHGFMNQSDRNIPNPTVCPTQTTTYTITVVDDENTYTDQVTVSVGSVDLRLFKPEVLAGNTTTMIPQGDEENIGGMTFVNLDNDDNDDEYDNNDGNVTGGDDELMKLVVRTTPPNNLHMQTVRINAISGGQNIRLWRNNRKSNGEYILGNNLNLPPHSSGNRNQTILWVEGIAPHNNQRETVLELEVVSNDVVCETDRVAITVVGVQEISWQGIGNGYAPNSNPQHTNNELDHNDPNLPATAAPTLSYRVFPGARATNPASWNTPNDIVELLVNLSVAPIEDISLHLKAFDIDDPFVENLLPGAGVLLDPNDGGGGGTYSGGADIHYTSENDNRGEIIAGDPSTKAGLIMDIANNSIQNVDNIATITIPLGTNNATLHFKVSHHPGDNYRVAANADLDFVQNLRNTDENHGIDIWDMNAAGMIQEPLHYASHILTVWRILHVESESMLDYNWTYTFNGPVQQKLSVINDFDGPVASQTQRIYCGGQISQFDASPNLSGGGGNGRFESGQIIIGLNNLQQPTPNSLTLGPLTLTPAGNISTIRGNGNNMIGFTNQESIVPVFGEVTDLNGVKIPITVQEIEKNAVGFTYQVIGVPNGVLPDLIQIKVGGGSNRAIVATNSNGGIDRIITNSSLSIPFLIRDDDNIPGTNVLPHQPNLVGLNTAFQDAYIICENDGGGDRNNNNSNTAFIENASTPAHMAAVNAQRQSAGNESPLFWVVYVTSAWQFSVLSDADANAENIHWGGTYPSTNTNHDTDIAIGGDYSFVYREAVLDVPPPLAEDLIIAHEVGHQFGLDHGDVTGLPIPEFPNIGLMSAGGNNAGAAPTNRFIARHLNLIRSRVNSPGE